MSDKPITVNDPDVQRLISQLQQENKRLRDTIEVVLEDVVTLRVLGVTNLTSIRELLKKALEVKNEF